MEALYKEYSSNEQVAFFFVYVNEAHPSPKPVEDARDTSHKGIGKAEKIGDRVLAASKCMVGLELSMPVLIDEMSGVAEKAYSGRPAATVVIDIHGKVRMHTTGPLGTQPDQARKVLEEILREQAQPPEEDRKSGGKASEDV